MENKQELAAQISKELLLKMLETPRIKTATKETFKDESITTLGKAYDTLAKSIHKTLSELK